MRPTIAVLLDVGPVSFAKLYSDYAAEAKLPEKYKSAALTFMFTRLDIAQEPRAGTTTMDMHMDTHHQRSLPRFQKPEVLLSGQNELLRMIAKGSPLSEVLNSLITFMESQSNKALCSVLVLDHSKSILRFAAGPTLPKAYNDFVDGIKVGPKVGSCGAAIFQREPVLVRSIRDDPLWEDTRDYALRHGLLACSSVPILDGAGEPLGTFAFYYREEILPDAYDWNLIEVSRDLASLAIQHAQHQEARDELYLRECEARLEAERLNAAKDDFMSVAAHELKTPIAAIKMQIDVSLIKYKRKLAEGSIPDVTEDLKRLQNLCERLIKLNENLLDVTRIRTQKLVLRLEQVDLKETLQNLIRSTIQYCDRVHCHLPEQPVIGTFDRQRVEQVVRNLVDIALKFGEGKPIELTLSHEDREARIRIADHGVGIPEDEQTKIFNRFAQLDAKTDVRGLGLGLYIVSEIVKAHKGTISVESQVGEGSAFTVRLPLSLEKDVSDEH